MDRRFRRLAAATTGLTFVLLLLGIYTAATGSGLACARRWPLCDGAVFGLFPATWPSFVEWFHRLVAMVAGFAILGTAVAAWRRPDRRVRYATAVAVVFLPAQVLLGAETVWTYTLLSRALHFVTALVILLSLVAATAWALPRPVYSLGRIAALLAATAALVPAALALGPRGFFVYSPGVQAISYAAGLAALAALSVTALRAPTALDRARLAAAGAAAFVAPTLLARRLVYTDALLALDVVATAAALALVLAALALVRRADRTAATADLASVGN